MRVKRTEAHERTSTIKNKKKHYTRPYTPTNHDRRIYLPACCGDGHTGGTRTHGGWSVCVDGVTVCVYRLLHHLWTLLCPMVLYSQYPDQSGVDAVILFTEPHPVLSLTIQTLPEKVMFRCFVLKIQTFKHEGMNSMGDGSKYLFILSNNLLTYLLTVLQSIRLSSVLFGDGTVDNFKTSDRIRSCVAMIIGGGVRVTNLSLTEWADGCHNSSGLRRGTNGLGTQLLRGPAVVAFPQTGRSSVCVR